MIKLVKLAWVMWGKSSLKQPPGLMEIWTVQRWSNGLKFYSRNVYRHSPASSLLVTATGNQMKWNSSLDNLEISLDLTIVENIWNNVSTQLNKIYDKFLF